MLWSTVRLHSALRNLVRNKNTNSPLRSWQQGPRRRVAAPAHEAGAALSASTGRDVDLLAGVDHGARLGVEVDHALHGDAGVHTWARTHRDPPQGVMRPDHHGLRRPVGPPARTAGRGARAV